MKKIKLHNGVRIIYEQRASKLSSFCIGFNAGALEERSYSIGTAHVVEHMVFKGTIYRNESEINKACDEVFGFHNAMTNYPYAIYYGTTHNEDFEKGFSIYSDIVMNPTFPKQGFKEEINVIIEELKEWKEDLPQHCEDLLYQSSFEKRRIKELIIGNETSVQDITLEEIRSFYNRYYTPENCVISITSCTPFEEVIKIVTKYFGSWEKGFSGIEKEEKEDNREGLYIFYENITGAKIKYCFSLEGLSDEELEIISVFNSILGDGVSSLLYDEIRTKEGLAYEVISEVKRERGIRLLTIYVSTSKENINKVLESINLKLFEVNKSTELYSEDILKAAVKRLKLKRELALERSIELCKRLTTYELMFGAAELAFSEYGIKEHIKPKEVQRVVSKVIKAPSIVVLK
jgi:predicted Zn-dependent peptidase